MSRKVITPLTETPAKKKEARLLSDAPRIRQLEERLEELERSYHRLDRIAQDSERSEPKLAVDASSKAVACLKAMADIQKEIDIAVNAQDSASIIASALLKIFEKEE